jgi:hypothetical protein
MERTAQIRVGVRLLCTAGFLFALSVSSWAQHARPTVQNDPKTIEYKNTSYGFSLTLPESWKGYQVLWSEWGGRVLKDDGSVAREYRGPELRIRHPKWTEQHPREDMPIMIFTIAQWNEHPVVSAAPFDPAELGRNRKYVFALPPRWNYDFAEGWEEAQKILSPDSLHTFKPAN